MTTDSASSMALDDFLITARPLSDYRDMFLLTDEELCAGPILDCPGGASPFGAQVRARGGDVVSVDPMYETPQSEFAQLLERHIARHRAWMSAYPGGFDWSYIGSPASAARSFEVSAEFFLTDYVPASENYVAAALPTLPFDDQHFRLSLCSHLLFSYPEHLSYEDHVASLLELIRVSSDEVRVYPLVDTAGRTYPRLDELRRDLADTGVVTTVRTANCSYHPGGDQMLSCRRSAS